MSKPRVIFADPEAKLIVNHLKADLIGYPDDVRPVDGHHDVPDDAHDLAATFRLSSRLATRTTTRSPSARRFV